MHRKDALNYVAGLLAHEAQKHYTDFQNAVAASRSTDRTIAEVNAVESAHIAARVVKTLWVAKALKIEQQFRNECGRLGVNLEQCLGYPPRWDSVD